MQLFQKQEKKKKCKCDNLQAVLNLQSMLYYLAISRLIDQWRELLCFQFATILKGLHLLTASVSAFPSHAVPTVLLTRPWTAFRRRSFGEQGGTRSSARAGENSWCCSLEKQLALYTCPVLHCTVRPTEEPRPVWRTFPSSALLFVVMERGSEIVFKTQCVPKMQP